MANTLSGNLWYVDTQASSSADDLTTSTGSVRIACIILTATASGGKIVFTDPKTGAVKLDLRCATDEQSTPFDFSIFPISCPNGLRAGTVSNAVASVVLARGGE